MTDNKPQDDGVSGGSPTEAGGEGSKPDGFVGIDSYTKAVDAEKSAKRRARELEAKLTEYETLQKKAHEEKLLEEKQYQELIQQKNQEIEQLRQTNDSHVRDKTDFQKLNAAMGLLQQKGINLESKYMGLIPIDSIAITEDGAVDQNSVSEVISNFEKEHPRLVMKPARPLPNDKSGSSGQTMTLSEWKKLGAADAKRALAEGRVKLS